ncbi:hypothetical protein [Terrabacter sp. 2RAF25]|uniref:hypothetical protein n=1 Tax=Terrabacter sp. 2RAF25 TaxID=3232998 RepID=UPI003F9B5121
MTIDDAFGRVIRGHWLLILLCIVAPYGVVSYVSRGEPDVYEAVARVQMGTELAASNVQADATSQRVLGIATSPGVVRSALDKARLRADANDFAAHYIDVRRVGVSPVMEIVVTDTSPTRAATIAKSITNDVIRVSNVGDQPTSNQRRQGVQSQLNSLARQRNRLAAKLNNVDPKGGAALSIQAQLTSLTTAQAELERQMSDLNLAAPSPSHAVLLDPVRVPSVALPRQDLQRAVLAALIGALVGGGLAAGLEALRPRLRSSRSIARALEVPHIGHLPRLDLSRRTTSAAGPVADRLALLARRYDASNTLAVLVDPRDEPAARPVATLLGPDGEKARHRVACSVVGRDWVEPGTSPVIAVLSPRHVKVRALVDTMSFVDALGWPVVGMISYPRRWFWQRRTLRRAAAKHEQPVAAGVPSPVRPWKTRRPEPVVPTMPVPSMPVLTKPAGTAKPVGTAQNGVDHGEHWNATHPGEVLQR